MTLLEEALRSARMIEDGEARVRALCEIAKTETYAQSMEAVVNYIREAIKLSMEKSK